MDFGSRSPASRAPLVCKQPQPWYTASRSCGSWSKNSCFSSSKRRSGGSFRSLSCCSSWASCSFLVPVPYWRPSCTPSCKQGMRHFLGISAFYHDSAAALVTDGKILSAAQEERFTRKKNDECFPQNALQFCLRHARITPQDVDAVVFYDKPITKFARMLET